jgi:uncharacterized membrane protein
MTKIKKQATVQAPIETVYAVWRNFENFPSFMRHIADVQAVSDTRSHWIVSGQLGFTAEWDAEMTLDEPNRAIGWRTMEEASSVVTAGRVNFKEAGPERTLLEVIIEHAVPGGPMGDLVARVFSNPERQVEEDLDRFRNIIEGVIPSVHDTIPRGDQPGGRPDEMSDVSDAVRVERRREASIADSAPRRAPAED